MATKLYNVRPEEIDTRTTEARWSNLAMRNWLCATQHWKWHGGDAIVVPTNDMLCWVAIRRGSKVDVVYAMSLNHAMEQVGLDPKNFKVCCRESV